MKDKVRISSIVESAWDKLDSETKTQHILSNSELYRSVTLIQQTLKEFRELNPEYSEDK